MVSGLSLRIKGHTQVTTDRLEPINPYSFDHTEIGKAMAIDWNLPQELAEVIGCHHNPDNIAQEFARLGSTLYVADYVCQQKGLGYSDSPIRDKELFRRCLKRLDVTSYALDLIVEDVEKELFKMEKQGLF
jgi:HD-like signal output (HDOD) protein